MTGTSTERRAAPAALDPLLTIDAFQVAIDKHGPMVLRYVASRVGVAAAEDVAAETFAAAWRSRAKFVDPSDNGMEAWLIGIATRLIAAHRRVEQRWLRMCADSAREQADASDAVDELDADARVDAHELARVTRIAELIRDMPDRERDPFFCMCSGSERMPRFPIRSAYRSAPSDLESAEGESDWQLRFKR